MKAVKPLLILIALILITTGAHHYFFGGPYRFVNWPLRPEWMERVRAGAAAGASWASSPALTADEYLHGWCHPSDRPIFSKLEISVAHGPGDQSVVTVINRNCQDDSVYVTCNRLTLQHRDGSWIPIRHQAAWQGRGRFGWTTKPAR